MIIVINDDGNMQVETRARKKRTIMRDWERERVIKDVKMNVSATEHIC